MLKPIEEVYFCGDTDDGAMQDWIKIVSVTKTRLQYETSRMLVSEGPVPLSMFTAGC